MRVLTGPAPPQEMLKIGSQMGDVGCNQGNVGKTSSLYDHSHTHHPVTVHPQHRIPQNKANSKLHFYCAHRYVYLLLSVCVCVCVCFCVTSPSFGMWNILLCCFYKPGVKLSIKCQGNTLDPFPPIADTHRDTHTHTQTHAHTHPCTHTPH